MINYYLLIISIINAIINVLFEWVFVEIANKFWWKRKMQKYKEKIKNEKNKEIVKYNIDTEIPIRKYINLYYYERRNKKMNEEEKDLYFIDDNEDEGIELEDMSPNGNVIRK